MRRLLACPLTAIAVLAVSCREEAPADPYNMDLGGASRPLLPTPIPVFDPAVNAARADGIVSLADLDVEPAEESKEANQVSAVVEDFLVALESSDPAPAFADRVARCLRDDSEFTLDAKAEDALQRAGAVLADDALSADDRDEQLAALLQSIGCPMDAPDDTSGG